MALTLFLLPEGFCPGQQLEWGFSFGYRLQSITSLHWAVLMEGSSKLWHEMTVLQRHKELIAFVVCRLLQPLEQALPGRRLYTSGLKCSARRIHSTTRSKPYSKTKVDTDFQTAGALTRFTVALPRVEMIEDTRKEKGEGK